MQDNCRSRFGSAHSVTLFRAQKLTAVFYSRWTSIVGTPIAFHTKKAADNRLIRLMLRNTDRKRLRNIDGSVQFRRLSRTSLRGGIVHIAEFFRASLIFRLFPTYVMKGEFPFHTGGIQLEIEGFPIS
jgi:hypothetical protein